MGWIYSDVKITPEKLAELQSRLVARWEQRDAPIHDDAKGLAADVIEILNEVFCPAHVE
jgi:hypothetical protein